MYNSLIFPHISCACPIWGYTYAKHKERIIKLQKKLGRILLFLGFNENSNDILKRLKWLSIEDIIKFETLKYIYKNINGFGCEMKFFESEINTRTRNNSLNKLKTSKPILNYRQNTLFFKVWNELDLNLRSERDIKVFIKRLKTYF